MAKAFSRNLSERTGSSSPSLASLPPLEAVRSVSSRIWALYLDFSQIVFSDAWWIGTQAENPEEAQLDFPKELTEGQHTEYDFKGGAGSTSANKQSDRKNETTYVEHSPNVKVEDNVLDDGNKDLMRATPVRHSARTAGKRFNFGNASSGDDAFESDT